MRHVQTTALGGLTVTGTPAAGKALFGVDGATASWQTYSGGGGGGISSPLTAKGDIFVRNAAADTRLPVGLANQFLRPASSQATGLKWQYFPEYHVDNYEAVGDGTTDDTAAITAAFAAANANSIGGTVVYGNKTYIQSNVVWKEKTNWRGQGIGRTIIKQKSGSNNDLFITDNWANEHNTNYLGYSKMSKNFARDATLDGNLSAQSLQAIQTDKSAYRYLIKYYGWLPYFEHLEFRNCEAAFYTEYSNAQPQEFEDYNISDGYFHNLTMINYARVGWTFRGPHDSDINNVRLFGGRYDTAEYDFLADNNGNYGGQGSFVHDLHVRSGNTQTGYNAIIQVGLNGSIYAEGSTNVCVLIQTDSANLKILGGFQDTDSNNVNDALVVLKPANSSSSVSHNVLEVIGYYGPINGDLVRIDNSANGTVGANDITTRVNNGVSLTGSLFALVGNMNANTFFVGGGQGAAAAFNTDAYTGGNNHLRGRVYAIPLYSNPSVVGKSDRKELVSDNYPDNLRISEYRWSVADKSPGFLSTGSDAWIEADGLQLRNLLAATAAGHGVNKGQMDTALALKQNSLTLTTTGTNGPASLSGSTLNIPNYAATGGGFTNPMTTAGDIIYENATPAATRLPAGTATQVLHSGATPAWGAVALATDVSGILPITNGGTGSTTQNFVDLTTAQTVAGVKTFSNNIIFNGNLTGSTSSTIQSLATIANGGNAYFQLINTNDSTTYGGVMVASYTGLQISHFNGSTLPNTSLNRLYIGRYGLTTNGVIIGTTSRIDINSIGKIRNLIDDGNGAAFFTPTVTGSSGVSTPFIVQPVITGTGTHGYTSLLVNVTETTVGTGQKNLADLQVGSASKWNVQNDGRHFLANVTTAPAANPTGGGYLYVEAGSLKFRGSSGTVTVLGLA